MPEVAQTYYRVGQVAKLFKTSTYHVRKLLQAGLMEAELSATQQWQISPSEVARFEKCGLPPVPQTATENASPRPNSASGHPALLGNPSEDLIKSAESVLATENLVKKLKLEQELARTQDWFDERQQEEAARLAEEEQAHREQQEAEVQTVQRIEREARRQDWFTRWQEYALHAIPPEARDQVEIELYEAISRVLVRLEPAQDRAITQRLVDAGVEQVLGPWRRNKEIASVLVQARDWWLPSEARGIGELSTWQLKAEKAAGAAISQLRNDAPIEEIRAVARQAVEKVAADFEAQKAARTDAELRALVLSLGTLPPRLNEKGRALARAAIVEALGMMPQGTSYAELARVRDAAIVPFQQLVDAAREQEAKVQSEQVERERQERVEKRDREQEQAQRAAEERRKQADQATRQAVLSGVSWKLPSDFLERKEQALAAACKAMGELPEGSSQRDLEQVRDRALRPLLDAHAQRQKKAAVIESGLREIFSYLLKLQHDWDFEGKTVWTLEREVKDPIRKRLEADLTGNEPLDQVQKRVRQLVRKELDIATRQAA